MHAETLFLLREGLRTNPLLVRVDVPFLQATLSVRTSPHNTVCPGPSCIKPHRGTARGSCLGGPGSHFEACGEAQQAVTRMQAAARPVPSCDCWLAGESISPDRALRDPTVAQDRPSQTLHMSALGERSGHRA